MGSKRPPKLEPVDPDEAPPVKLSPASAVPMYAAIIVAVGILAAWTFWAFAPDSRAVPGEETADEVAESGILAGLSEHEMGMASEGDVARAVEDGVELEAAAVTGDSQSSEEAVEEDLTSAAAGSAAAAAIEIVDESSQAVAQVVEKTAPRSVTPEVATDAAAAIVESAVGSLDLEPSTLDDEETVSASIDSAVTKALDDERATKELKSLTLTDDQEASIQEQTAQILTSQLLQSSAVATEKTVGELSQPVIDSLDRESKEILGGPLETAGAVLGSLGVGGTLTTAVTSVFRRCPLKIERIKNRRLRYAVANNCTLEGVRLERPILPFISRVSRDTAFENRSLPSVVSQEDGLLSVRFAHHVVLTFSWNLRVWWWHIKAWEFGNYYYTVLVNGRWYPFEIPVCAVAVEGEAAETEHRPPQPEPQLSAT